MFKSQNWKGVTAGVLLMATAIVGAILGYTGYEGEVALSINEAISMFLNGLGILGIRLAVGK